MKNGLRAAALTALLVTGADLNAATAVQARTFNVAPADCLGFVVDLARGLRAGDRIVVAGVDVALSGGGRGIMLDRRTLLAQCGGIDGPMVRVDLVPASASAGLAAREGRR